MPLDPEARALLDAEAADRAPFETLSVEDARRRTVDDLVARRPVPVAVAGVEDRTIPGPGGPLRLRIYTPPGIAPRPLLLFFHGGGFVVCDLDTHDALCRDLCRGADCVIVAVDYRLAPEAPFPAAPDDCLAATRWAAAHADEFGADPERVVVAGDSAGGNLAAVTALRLRDEGGPALRGQLLIYPVTDHYRSDPASYRENAEGFGLTRAQMVWFWDHYLDRPADAVHPHASPLRAPVLRDLPPALVLTAHYDPLRDEGDRYAERLAAAGVTVTHLRYPGMIHGFLSVAEPLTQTRRAIAQTCAWLRDRFAPTSA